MGTCIENDLPWKGKVMYTRRVVLVLSVVLLLVAGASAKEKASRPHIGIRLDTSPLPELLVKHLGLKPGQGIRISNVTVGSPAQKNGLERDDIITRFQGQDVMDTKRFVAGVREAGTEVDVSLEIIHLGQPKILEFKLDLAPTEVRWKYVVEPDMVASWRPGKVFQAGPDGKNWMEMSISQMPNVDVDVKKFFRDQYFYHHVSDGEDYTITIKGDPKDEASTVVVKADDGVEHSITVGQLDELPEKYREPVKEAIEGARQSESQVKSFRMRRQRSLPEPPKPEVYRQFFEKFTLPEVDLDPLSRQKEQMLEDLQKHMEELQQRMKEMEERHLDTLKRPAPEDKSPGENTSSGGTSRAQPMGRSVT
jgi:PDZ domain-containing protein